MRDSNQPKCGRRGQAGYNLVEVMVAMGLLATVLVSIVSLFVMGRRNVYSGKEMTAAVSMATRVSEDLSGMTVDEIYSAFGVTSTAPMTTITVDTTAPKTALPNNTYTGSIVRRTTDVLDTTATGNDAGGFLSRWKSEMDTNLRFAQGA